MIDDKNNIIEAEVVDVSLDDPNARDTTPKPVLSDKRDQIIFWGTVSSFCFRFGIPIFLIGVFSGLAFSILYGEVHSSFYLVLLIIGFSLCGLAVIATVIGFIGRAMMAHYIKQDPNYERKL